MDNGEKVIIKFCERYSEVAHKLLDGMGYPPKLYCCSDVSSRFKMVVMEFVEGTPICDYFSQEGLGKKQDILAACWCALQGLHDKNLCHGDFRFRETNVLIRKNGNVCVLDYDWAGRMGQVRYPGFMNHTHLTWPCGASDEELITREHDIYWLHQLSKV